MKSHRGISFLSVQENSPPSVEASLSLTFHISPFSGRSAGKRQALCRQWCLWGRLLGVVGPGLPLRAVCKWSWTWEIGGQCQVSLVLFQVLWNQIESATKAAPRGACGGGSVHIGLCGWYTAGLPVLGLGKQVAACLCRGHQLQMGPLGLQNKAGLPQMENTIRQGKCSKSLM